MKNKPTIKTSEAYWKLKEFSKENRLNPTHSEKIMWYLLKNKNLNTKFRRQHIIGEYIVDFVSLQIKLIIELDGDSHEGREEYDQNRQKYLENLDYKVIRFTNEELFENGNKVEQKIKDVITNIIS